MVDQREHYTNPSVISSPNVELPTGYLYGVTRYADLILKEAFPAQFSQLIRALDAYHVDVKELVAGGGSRATHTKRFDESLGNQGWGKRNISISRYIDGKQLHVTKSHEIDMFSAGSNNEPYPGIGVEMEWNNKDPFYDRDLLNFQALHREGALAVGVIITRGPRLQDLIGPVIKSSSKAENYKFGQSSTHWDKLVPRVNLGGGGECPLILIGIEPERITGNDIIFAARKDGNILFNNNGQIGIGMETHDE
jgi:hypothetical protein